MKRNFLRKYPLAFGECWKKNDQKLIDWSQTFEVKIKMKYKTWKIRRTLALRVSECVFFFLSNTGIRNVSIVYRLHAHFEIERNQNVYGLNTWLLFERVIFCTFCFCVFFFSFFFPAQFSIRFNYISKSIE